MTVNPNAVHELKNFLRLALPPEGYYCAAVFNVGRKAPEHHWFDTVDELAAFMLAQDAAGHTVYHACASYKKKGTASGGRTQENVHQVACLWFDVEGKDYPDASDEGLSEDERNKAQCNRALKAVAIFCHETGLQPAACINSGHGVHVYLRLEQPLGPDAWQPYGEGIKTLAREKGLEFDPARTADAASILRPPGSHNRKHDAVMPVTLLGLDSKAVLTLAKLPRSESPARKAKAKAPAEPMPNVPAWLTRLLPAGKAIGEAAGAGIDEALYPSEPADANAIADRCAQMRVMRDTKGRLPEPLWRANVINLSYCKDGNEIAHEWSKGDERYSAEQTQKKIDTAKEAIDAPITCQHFIDNDVEHRCQGCPFRDKITTPVQLGRRQATTPPVASSPAGAGTSVEVGSPPVDPNADAIALTDVWNSKKLIARHGQNIRYVPGGKDGKSGYWLMWDGEHWRTNADGKIFELAKDTVYAMHGEALNITFEQAKKDLLEWAMKSSSNRAINAMVDLAKTDPVVKTNEDCFDSDDFLLGVQNGVIELKTQTFRPARREDHVTKLMAVSYDPTAQCPHWLDVMKRITAGDDELAAFIQRAIGYSLTGCVHEEMLFFLQGGGRNLKSTFRETFRQLFGDYAATAAGNDLLVMDKFKGGARPSPELVALSGKRFVSLNETAEDVYLDVNQVKTLTSTDKMSARQLYRGMVEFQPHHKLWLTSNNRPRVKENSLAIWRRLSLIECKATIAESEDVKDFQQRYLQPERPGILNWALAGLRDYLTRMGADGSSGLNPPDSVRLSVAEYQAEQDVFGQWLDERCEQCDLKIGTQTMTLHEDYVRFTGWKNTSVVTFVRDLKKHGFKPDKISGRRVVPGLRLLMPASFSEMPAHGART